MRNLRKGSLQLVKSAMNSYNLFMIKCYQIPLLKRLKGIASAQCIRQSYLAKSSEY